jgi:hypothetical protein
MSKILSLQPATIDFLNGVLKSPKLPAILAGGAKQALDWAISSLACDIPGVIFDLRTNREEAERYLASILAKPQLMPKVGDVVLRYLADTNTPMKLEITAIEDDKIICGGWTFDGETGWEIDDYLDWGPPPKKSGSYIYHPQQEAILSCVPVDYAKYGVPWNPSNRDEYEQRPCSTCGNGCYVGPRQREMLAKTANCRIVCIPCCIANGCDVTQVHSLGGGQ